MSCRESFRARGYVLGLFAIAFVIALGWYALDARVGFNLADEGFLWYGSEALLRGEVPMRDFEAYDPGRYAWAAGGALLFGHTVIALRLSCSIFGALGVFAGLLATRRVSRNWFFLGGVALLLSVWMHPRYKVFEQSIALMAVYAGVLLLERPSLRRHWWVGFFGGVCAVFGRNHGVYHVLAFSLLIIAAAWRAGWRKWVQNSCAWAAGIFTGYLPQALMFLFIPGFAHAYLPCIQTVVTKGTTNLARPVVWPWLVRGAADSLFRASVIAQGCGYVALLVFLAWAALRLWQLRAQRGGDFPTLFAAACVAIPYTHYVFSRPDIVHLAHGFPVAAVGLLAVIVTLPRVGRCAAYASVPVLAIGSLLAQVRQIGMANEYLAPEKSLYRANVAGENMLLNSFNARAVVSAQHVAQDLAKPDEAIFFAPHAPGLYTFTGRRSPTNQIYFVFPASEETDRHLVEELEAANLQWAMVQDYALDGRDELRFQNTNPFVCKYLRQNFGVVPLSTLPSHTVLLHRIKTPGS